MKLEIPPHRHKRLSPNEVVIDLGFVCLWLLSSSSILWYGRCYELTSINAAKIVEPCIPWNICAACGYIASLMHLVTVVMGVIDIVKHEKRFDPNARTIAKGSWEKWHDD